MLADWAAIAIDNARLYRDVRQRRDELERAVRGLEATTEIARALGGETDLEPGARAGGQARRARWSSARGGARCCSTATSSSSPPSPDRAWRRSARASPIAEGSVAGGGAADAAVAALRATCPSRASPSCARRAHRARRRRWSFRNRRSGSSVAFDRLSGDARVQRRGRAAAAGVRGERRDRGGDRAERRARRLRASLQASEPSAAAGRASCTTRRCRSSAGLKVLLSGARRSDEPERLDGALDQAVEQITDGIANLRALITELRPAALDELGPEPALEALVERVARAVRARDRARRRLAYEDGAARSRHMPRSRHGLPARPGGADQRRQARRGARAS